jgi:rhodanese-related sulfurtransferase
MRIAPSGLPTARFFGETALARLLQRRSRVARSASLSPQPESCRMTQTRSIVSSLLVATLLAGAAFAATAQDIAGGASDPAAVKRVNDSLASPWKFKTKRLSRTDVDALLAKPDSVIFIDLRRPDEFIKFGSFPVFLSVQNKDLEKQLAWLPRDRGVVTVSNHSQRAGAAGDLLTAKGFNVLGATGSEEYEVAGGTNVAHVQAPPPRIAGAASQPRP